MNDSLGQKELLLLDVIAVEGLNQRKISRASGLSLGLTNLLLKKLVNRGYVKVVNLNGRTLKYILTPQGMREKLAKSYGFVLRSVRMVFGLRDSMLRHLEGRSPADTRVFLLGKNELRVLATEVLSQANYTTESLKDHRVLFQKEEGRLYLVFNCDMNLKIAEGKELPSWVKAVNLYEVQV